MLFAAQLRSKEREGEEREREAKKATAKKATRIAKEALIELAPELAEHKMSFVDIIKIFSDKIKELTKTVVELTKTVEKQRNELESYKYVAKDKNELKIDFDEEEDLMQACRKIEQTKTQNDEQYRGYNYERNFAIEKKTYKQKKISQIIALHLSRSSCSSKFTTDLTNFIFCILKKMQKKRAEQEQENRA